MAENQLQPAGALTPAQRNIMEFKKKLDGNYIQQQLKQVLKENAGTFATSLMEVYTNDKQLQACDPNLVLQEAVKAASLKLPLNKQLGYGFLLVFNNYDKNTHKSVPTPTFVPGYRAYIQMAMRTGQYRVLNADIVYEGELQSRDKLTGAIDLNGERVSDKVVGYFAHFELINGFSQTWYMSVEQMAEFARINALAFKYAKEKPSVDELVDLAQQQAKNGPTPGQTGWRANFNAMAVKTVLRNLLGKYGFLSIEMMQTIDMEKKREYEDAEVIRDEENSAPKVVVNAADIIQPEEVKEAEVSEPPI